MEVLTLPIYSTEGKEVETIKLNAKVFNGLINTAALYQVINAYRAGQRCGLAQTKTRGEVSGGGRKPWRQKGTGRARVGSTRSPLWRHGGVIFGPHPRDFSYAIPQRLKAQALKTSLNLKVKENNLMLLDKFSLETPKTKDALNLFLNLKVVPKAINKRNYSVLLLLDKVEGNLRLSLRNLAFLNINLARDTHAYEVMKNKRLIITKKALEELVKRLS